MLDNLEKTCVICSAEFLTRFQKQVYCSYDCYSVAARTRSASYYAAMKKANLPVPKICPSCHNQFETVRRKVKYCSEPCSRQAKLEKCRAYSQNLREQWKAANPKSFIKECSLCYTSYDYKTKQGKYCSEECAKLGKQYNKAQGPINMPGKYKDLKPGDTVMATAPKTFGERDAEQTETGIECFICNEKTAPDAQTPCAKCN